MKRYSIFLSLLFVLSTTPFLFSQQLCGKLVDENSDALPGVLITLIGAVKSDFIIRHTTSNENGKWCIDMEMGATQIKVSILGYNEQVINLESQNIDKDIIIRLKPKLFQLDSMTISEKKQYINIRGDTLEYNVGNYRSTTDRDLKDLLNKMEGIEVTKDGDIKYNSKRIDKLLIEGKDILNDQHKMTIEALAPINIRKIQIIQNYKPFHEKFFDRMTPKVAMNFLLTDEAKGKINGDAKCGGGIVKKYEGVINLFTIYDSLGYSSFVRSNNLGEQVISTSDFLNMESDITRALNKSGGNFDKLIPEGLQRKEKDQMSSDHLVAFNLESDQSSKVKNKISLLASLYNRKSASKVEQTQLQENKVLLADRDNGVRAPFLFLVLNRKVTMNKNSIFEIDIPIRYNSNYSNENLIGKIELSPIENELLKSENSFAISPSIFFSNKTSDRFRLNLEAQAIIIKEVDDRKINSSEPLFDTENNNVFQISHQKNIGYSMNGRLNYRKNQWSLDMSIPMELKAYSLSLDDDLMKKKISVEFNTFSTDFAPRLSMKYKTKSIWIEPVVSIPFSRITIGEKVYSNRFINPSLKAKYAFSLLHFFLLKIRNTSAVYNPTLRFSGEIIGDGGTIRKNFINEEEQSQKSYIFSVSYFRLNPANGFQIHSSFDYGIIKNNIFTSIEVNENYITQITRIAKEQRFTNLGSSLQVKCFKRRLIGKFTLNWRHTETESDEEYAFDSKSIGIDLVTNLKKGINFGLKYITKINSQSVDEVKVSFLSDEIYGQVWYSANRFRYSTDITYHLRKGNSFSSRFAVWNLGFEIDILQRVQLFFRGRDVLNLNARIITNIRLFDNYSEVENFVRFPGSLVVGVRRKF